jgi:hypothetical protein
MHLALRLGKSVEETARLTATELYLWSLLDKPVAEPPPARIADFFAKVRTCSGSR